MSRGAVAAAWTWARSDLRRRWRSLVALGVLAGITAAFSLTALAGMRRTHTALGRLRTTTRSADALVFGTQRSLVGTDYSRLRAQPEVADMAGWDLLFGNLNGQPNLLFGADDDRFGRDIDRPVVVKGRMWNPNAPDEVIVDENAQRQAPLGSTFTFQPYASDQKDADFGPNPPHGPVTKLHVVGVVRETAEFLFVSDGQGFVSPGYMKRYHSQVLRATNVNVVLRHQPGAVHQLQQDVTHLIGAGVPVLDTHAVQRRVTTTLAVETAALLTLAVVVAVAGSLLVLQALSRSAAVVGDDAMVLRAVGMSERHTALAAALAHVPAALVAGAVAVVGAVAASRLLPIGLARHIDPNVGTHADLTVLVPGLLATVLLVAVGALTIGWRASRRAAGLVAPRPSLTAGWIRRWAPLSVGLGATLALERRPGRANVPVRPALVGAVVGVLGVIGALTVNAGLHHAIAHPELAGVTWDLTADLIPNGDTSGAIKPEVLAAARRAVPPGSQLAIADRITVDVNGVGVPTFAIRPTTNATRSPIDLELVRGHAPRSPDEAVIGPATAREVHTRIGDTITIGSAHRRARVVGEALFPDDVHAEFDEGLLLESSAFDAVAPPNPIDIGRALLVRLPNPRGKQAAIGRLTAALGHDAGEVAPAAVPIELANLRHIRRLPELLAGFLALLAIAALSHVLVTSARRGTREFAILRALGLRRRSTRLVLTSQGTIIGLVGLLLGVPLGIVLGRQGWRLVSDRVPLADIPPFALAAVLLVVPVSLAVVNALALLPARRAARVSPAVVLRTE